MVSNYGLVYVLSIFGRCSTLHLYKFMGFSSIEFVIDNMTNIGFGLVSILTVLLGMWNRHEAIEFVRIIRRFDQMVWLSVIICIPTFHAYSFQLLKFRLPHNDQIKTLNKRLWFSSGAAISISVMLIIPCSATIERMLKVKKDAFWSVIICWICLIVFILAQMTLAIWYSSILHSICIRFRLLNMLIVDSAPYSRICENPYKLQISMIERWSRMHDDLADALSIINKCYALPVRIHRLNIILNPDDNINNYFVL